MTTFGAAVRPSPGLDGHFDVTPAETVGAAMVGDTVVVIRPKIRIERLLFLLEYTADPTSWRDGQATLGSAPDLVTGMASVFARLATQALDQGLLSGYHSTSDDSYTVRGRVDLATQLRRRPAVDLPIAVSYQEYDENILENQLLLAAVRLLRPLPIRDTASRGLLRRIADSLVNVDPVRYHPNAVPAVHWDRLNQHYRPAVEFARLLLRHRSIDLREGPHGTPALVLKMDRLFEQFVRTALRHALGVTESDFPPGDAAPTLHLDHQTTVRLMPDLSLWAGGTCRFVGDAKYKRDLGRGHNDDLYQLLAYATALGLPDATLVYAEGPETATRHDIRGTAIAIHRYRLDLAAGPAELLEQVVHLANHIRAQQTALAGSQSGATPSPWSRAQSRSARSY
jgi:5-methylcytosine-specific restriction enzyme subunit McrC